MLQPSPRPPSGPGPAACHVALLLLLLLLAAASAGSLASELLSPLMQRTAGSGPRFPLCLEVFNVTSIRF